MNAQKGKIFAHMRQNVPRSTCRFAKRSRGRVARKAGTNAEMIAKMVKEMIKLHTGQRNKSVVGS